MASKTKVAGFYTGIGSRATPDRMQRLMQLLAIELARRDWVLRSGAAAGADTAFEAGALTGEGHTHIYLPWKGFRAHQSPLHHVSEEALAIAERIHPRWRSLHLKARLLHGRNIHQVLGSNLQTPSRFVVCWTPDGEPVGGTRTAIKLAEEVGVPVFNLAREESMERILAFLDIEFVMPKKAKDAQPYEWDFSGACAPTEDGKWPAGYRPDSFTLGIFQWVPTADGKHVKRGKVAMRVKGYNTPKAIKEAYAQARQEVDARNADRVGFPEGYTLS